jgi:uncharacterized protein YegL
MTEEMVHERDWVEEGQLVMPFYLICDVSLSMKNDMPALNNHVRALRRAIVAEPVVDDVAQICVMSFSNDAKVVMPMGQMSAQQEVPELRVEGGTSYGAAFRGLAQAIGRDSAALRAHKYKVYRPCAFFLTDGQPNDRDWHQTFTSTLTYDQATGQGMKAHPIFVPFGFRDAREDVLRQLAYPKDRGKWYHTKTHDVGQALKGILEIIMNTVVTSGHSVGAGQPVITQQAPAPGSGIQQGDSDFDPGYDPDYVW